MNSFLLNQYTYTSMFNGGTLNRGNIFSNKNSFRFNNNYSFAPKFSISKAILGNSGFFVDTSRINPQTYTLQTNNFSLGANTFGSILGGSLANRVQTNIFGNSIYKKRKPVKTATFSTTKTSSTALQKTYASPPKTTPRKTDLRTDFLKTSNRYMGYNEADGSSRAISNSGEWCADFIKFVINKTYREKGLVPPTKDLKIEPGMPHLRVQNIKDWGIDNGTYLSVANRANKADIIRNKVKPGDVIILRENGASHTGFVTKVYADGSFDSIEGNRNDRVMNAHYSANDPSLSGFVQVRS